MWYGIVKDDMIRIDIFCLVLMFKYFQHMSASKCWTHWCQCPGWSGEWATPSNCEEWKYHQKKLQFQEEE